MDQIEELSNFLSILGDETRLGIIYHLKEGNLVSKDIQEALNKAQSTISQHLKILYKADIIDYDQDGSKKIYKIKNKKIFKILRTVGIRLPTPQKIEVWAIDDHYFHEVNVKNMNIKKAETRISAF